ncbi:MAG: hypothetical protein ACKOF3_13385 [Spartobacteria bacterium]
MPAKKLTQLARSEPLVSDERLARGRARVDARFTAPPSLAGLPDSYSATFQEIKSCLQGAHILFILEITGVKYKGMN